MNFILIGDGAIAKYHRKAIQHVGGDLIGVVDPAKYPGGVNLLEGTPTFTLDTVRKHAMTIWKHSGDPICVVIASPSYMHREQIKFVLNEFPADTVIICEKPAFLPWEPPIDHDRINVCLQLRYTQPLPVTAEKVVVRFVRDGEYFKSWKGSVGMTGGLFFNLFIHYIDLAHRLNAEFEGSVQREGTQERVILRDFIPEDLEFINDPEDPRRAELESEHKEYRTPIGTMRRSDDNHYWMNAYDEFPVKRGGWAFRFDLMRIDMQACYNRMYAEILAGNGIHPKDLFYLDWILKRNSEIFGYGRNGIGKTIKIGKELL